MSSRFVFSTRYIGKKYAFAERHPLGKNSIIADYLKSHLWNYENLWELYRRYKKDEMKDFFESKNVSFDEELDEIDFQEELKDKSTLFEETIFQFVEEKKRVVDIKNLGSFEDLNDDEKFDSRFSYYTLASDCQTDDYKVFAVPHLNWKSDKEWGNCLKAEETFTKDLGQSDTLYLIMHDGDVPNHEHTPFELLDDNIYTKHLFKTKVIVFQHSSNDVVDILKKPMITEDEVSNKIVSLFDNKDTIEELFENDITKKEETEKRLRSLNPDCSVDLNDKLIKQTTQNVIGKQIEVLGFDKGDNQEETLLQSGRHFFVYSDDNGALLNELMHVSMTLQSAKRFKRFVEKLREPGHKGFEVDDIHKFCFPLIIKVYLSFFTDWEKAVDDTGKKEKIRNHRNKKALVENLERVFSFFNNSSIWIRLVDIHDQDAYNRAVAEFNYFDSIGLFDYNSAWENLEYNTRVFCHNYLESTLEGHGNFVTPELYGDEEKALDILRDNFINY